MTLYRKLSTSTLLLFAGCLVLAGPLAAHEIDCEHSHPGGGTTLCEDSHGDPCTTEEGEEGTCKQLTKKCLCVASAVDEASPATDPRDSARQNDDDTGRPALVQVTFKVQGLGSFSGGGRDTAKGHQGGLFGRAAPLLLRAKPAPGMRFQAWFLNGNFASTENPHKVFARAGLVITAKFVSADRDSEARGLDTAMSTAAADSSPGGLSPGARTCSYTCFNHTCSIECHEGKEAKCSCRQVKKQPDGWQWLPYCRCL